MRLFLFVASALLFVLPQPARAQCGGGTLPDLPDGQMVINFSATEQSEVEQDLLVVRLSYAASGDNSQALQSEIHQVMKQAIDRAKAEADIDLQAGAYQAYETIDSRTQASLWRGSQSLMLKSTHADTLLAVSDELQNMKLSMNGFSYTLDPEKAARTKDELVEVALENLQKRAQRAAKVLGKSEVDLRNVVIANNKIVVPDSQNYSRRMALDATSGMSIPVADAEEAVVSITVNGTAVLKP